MELSAEDGGQRQCILVTNDIPPQNIATRVTRERLLRVITGKGSQGESVPWQYSSELPYLYNNSIRVFDIVTERLTIADTDRAEQIKDIAKANFAKLNIGYNPQDDWDVYTQLSALNPYKEQDE